tara:strand:+ start:353 stop:841 length:489 start_codon:yes stop_codon:yes gene_type:complete
MRLYTEYVFLFTLAFLLFVTYLIITVRSDNVDFDINGTKIPNLAQNNVYQLYINANCTNGSYQSLKYNNSGFVSNNKELIISSITIPGNSSSKGTFEIGYADNDINCQVAAPTNPVVLYQNSTPTSNTLSEFKTFIKIPKSKIPYVKLTGYNYELAAIGVEQ